jgi:TPR repeat protein
MSIPWYRKLLPGPILRSAADLQAQAAAAGPEAQNNLGILFASTSNFPQDHAKAAACFQSAADRGYALAQNNLGLMYSVGEGVPKDSAEARKWFLRAAAQGDPGAQYHLGVKYHRDSLALAGVAAGEARIEAYMWLRLAATQGYRDAEMTCERVNLSLSAAEHAEAGRRVAGFASREEQSAAPQN